MLGVLWYVMYRADLACNMAMTAVQTVTVEKSGSQREIDIKRYARVEKIPGGTIEESEVLQGIMINKDVTHPRMKRYSIVKFNCRLSYHLLQTYRKPSYRPVGLSLRIQERRKSN